MWDYVSGMAFVRKKEANLQGYEAFLNG